MEAIKKRLSENETNYSVAEVVSLYEEKVQNNLNDFDYQVTIEPWQISHKTEKGYYIHVDYGFGQHGQVFVGAYKVDALDDGNYNLYIKKKDFFYFMNEEKAERNKYMTGETLTKQLSLYNGHVPLKKEPVMSKLDELVQALNFISKNKIGSYQGFYKMEQQFLATFEEAKEAMKELDEKILALYQIEKVLAQNDRGILPEENLKTLKTLLPERNDVSEMDEKEIQETIASIQLSRNLLDKKMNQTTEKINYLREVRAYIFQDKKSEKADKKTL